MKNILLLALVFAALVLSAQDGDVEIRVRRASPIYLTPDPDTSVIINYVQYTFTLRGLPAESLVRAYFTSGSVEVKDSLVYVKAICQFPADTGSKELSLKLHITTRAGKHISTLDKTLLAVPPLKKASNPPAPFPSMPTYSIVYDMTRRTGVQTYNSTQYRIWRNRILPEDDKNMRKKPDIYFNYSDSTGVQRQYRMIDMMIELGGRTSTFHIVGNKISPEMCKVIKKQKGKTSFSLLLYKQFIKGDRTRRVFIDTIRYEARSGVAIYSPDLGIYPLCYIPVMPYICTALYKYDYQERRRDRPGDVLATLICTKPNGTVQIAAGANSCC